jgi:hypothetical protein
MKTETTKAKASAKKGKAKIAEQAVAQAAPTSPPNDGLDLPTSLRVENRKPLTPAQKAKVEAATEQKPAPKAQKTCKSASNMDPGRYRRKPLDSRRFLGNRWGHDWTPIKSSENLQFRS